MSRRTLRNASRATTINAAAAPDLNCTSPQLFDRPLQWLAHELQWIRLRAQRIACDNKLAAEPEMPRQRYRGDDDHEDPRVVQLRRDDLSGRETALRSHLDACRQLHIAQGSPLPLDALAALYQLNDFEATVVLLAASAGFSAEFRDLWELVSPNSDSSLSVENLFNFCEVPWADRLARRRSFASQSPLVANQLVAVHVSGRLNGPGDLLQADVETTTQTFAYLAGMPDLDAEFVDFSSLEEPMVTLDQVVLPAADRRRILSVVDRHDAYLTARHDWGFDDVIRYGRGMLMLFHGAPGTGKTMTAHAVAKHLGRRVLNVDIPTFVENREADRFLPGLFREARLHNALLFFDECEMLFSARRHGNALMTLLLTELERFEGVAILATNVPQALDEALDRRILVKVHFAPPDREARAQIWRKHLPSQAPIAADVEVDALADRFEMSGGYIKNAVLMALADAVHTGGDRPELTMAMLERAARDQCQRPSDDDARHDLVQPKVRLSDLVLPDDLREQVLEVVAAARNRRTVLERWGIGAHLTAGKGVAALLHGQPGTGKTLCAEAIANELCRPLLVAQIPALLSRYVGGTEGNLAGMFKDAKAQAAVLLLDECDALLTDRDAVTQRHDVSAVTVLLGLIERHDGVVLLATNRPGKLDAALTRRLGWQLAFPMPDAWLRSQIWQGLLPQTVPVQGTLDFGRLGRKYPMTGGHIRNAVFKAALRAANRQQPMTMAVLEEAAQQELVAAGGVEDSAVVREVAEG